MAHEPEHGAHDVPLLYVPLGHVWTHSVPLRKRPLAHERQEEVFDEAHVAHDGSQATQAAATLLAM